MQKKILLRILLFYLADGNFFCKNDKLRTKVDLNEISKELLLNQYEISDKAPSISHVTFCLVFDTY